MSSASGRAYLTPAIRFNGKTYRGATHLNALSQLGASGIPVKQYQQAQLDGANRGYVDHRGKYLDRYDAADYARNYDLFKSDAPSWARSAPEIISEHLKPEALYMPPKERADGGSVDVQPAQPAPDDSRSLTPLGLYSHAADVVNRMPQMKGTPQQFKAMLLKQGVKPDELKWSGYDTAHAGKPMITKQELKQHFEQGLPNIQETEHSERPNDINRSSKYALPEVLRAAQQAGSYEGDLGLTLANDGNVYRALTRRFPELADNEDWAEHVAQDVFGGGTKPKHAPKFAEYTLPGGKNYRELLLHTPAEKKTLALHRVIRPDGHGDSNWSTAEQAAARAQAINGTVASTVRQDVDGGYKSSHWDTPNVLAHIRMSDRKDGKKKILHIEELQSDWAQQGRKEGFKASSEEEADIKRRYAQDPDGTIDEYNKRINDARIPVAPYVDSTQKWVDLGLKRILHEAAKGGYDKVVFTPGEEQAKRYDLSKQISRVHLADNSSGGAGKASLEGPFDRGVVTAHDHSGREVVNEHVDHPEKLHALLGQELAEKLLAAPAQHGSAAGMSHRSRQLEGLDLTTGGEGMKTFYDKVVPQALEKLARKHDPAAKVQLGGHKLHKGRSVADIDRDMDALHERGDINADAALGQAHTRLRAERNKAYGQPGSALHSLDITPKLRESILKGQPAYAAGGAVDRAYGGRAKENDNLWWHGSGSGDLRGGKSGLHLGTKAAATDALRARIGWPAEGSWDGKRKYGETLLAGKRRLKEWGPYNISGHNVDAPDDDYYPHQHPKGMPPLSGRDVPMIHDMQPSLRAFKIKGPMSNTISSPHPDFKANGYMAGALKKGNAKRGYYYSNDGEDSSSISAVVPNGDHVEPNDAKLQKAAGGSVDHAPSDAQKAAGNYAKEHISFQGIPIAIENKLGSVRTGRDARGRAWSCKLPADYGYIKRTTGADGDHVDCYVGPSQRSPLVVLVNQLRPDGKFDEHKCLLGFESERDALDCYVKAFSDGKGADRIGSVEVMSLDAFRKWLSSGKTKQPVRPGSIVDRALSMVSGNA